MKLLSALFLASLLLGQLAGIPVYPGVVIYIHDVLLAMLLLVGFVQFAVTSTFIKPKLTTPIVLFILVAVFSLFTNSGRFSVPDLEVSALYLVRWIFYAALYVVVLQSYTKKELWLYGLYGSGVGLAVLGFAQFFLYPDLRNLSYLGWDPHYYRLFSTLLDPNFTGILLVLTLLLGVYLWMQTRWWIVVGECIAFVSLLLTYSRSSYVAFIAGLMVFVILKKQWVVMLGIAAFISVVVLLPKTPGSTLDILRVDSSIARIGNWQESLLLIAKAPIFGHGFNTMRYVNSFGLDSSILFVGATTGIAGLFAYGYLIYSMIRLGRRNIWYIACLAALFVHSLFVNSAFYPWVMLWLWIITGIVERTSGGKQSFL